VAAAGLLCDRNIESNYERFKAFSALFKLSRRARHRYSFETLVHELPHLSTIDEKIDHGPLWKHECNAVARSAFGVQLQRDI
jgi:hypothetical protein